MFPSQMSTRDLLPGNYRHIDSSRDFSQLENAQFTQFEMSQNDSLDFCSQPDQLISGTSQDKQSQGRRMSSYEKYMSKPLFGNNSQGQSKTRKSQTNPRPTLNPKLFQQEMNEFKSRVKEREERDMLSSIVNVVKECSDQVKQNLSSLKEVEQDTGDVLTKAVDKLSNTVEESSFKILKAIHAREELLKQNTNLQEQIQKKDEKIQELLQQNSETPLKDNAETMKDALKAFLNSQHDATEQKLQKILDTAKGQLGLMQELESYQKSGQEDNQKHHADLKHTYQRQLQDMEKRLQNELINLRDDFEHQKRDIENIYKNQTQTFHQKYAREIEQQIYRGMENNVSVVRECTQELYSQQQSEIRDILQEKQKGMDVSSMFQRSKQSDKQLKQTQEENLKTCKDMKKEIAGKLNFIQTQQQQLKQDNEKQYKQLRQAIETSESDRPWLNDNVPKKVQEQLNQLHNDHMNEIKRLENEIAQERQKRELLNENEQRKKETLECTRSLENTYDFTTTERSNRKRDSAANYKSGDSLFGNKHTFLSPRPRNGTAWNSKTLFGRINPSPVATVLPQRKTDSDNQTAKFVQQKNFNQETKNQSKIQVQSNGRNKMGYNNMNQFNHSIDNAGETNTSQNETSFGQDWSKPDKKRKRKRTSAGNRGKEPTKRKSDRSNRQNSNTTAKELQSYNEIGKVQSVAPIYQQSISQYNFHDDSPPAKSSYLDTRNLHKNQSDMSRDYSVARPEILMSPESDSSQNKSSSSSPSLSVTEVFIRRRIRHDVKTPLIKGTETDFGLADLLSTPNLTEMFTERKVERIENIQTQKSTAVRRHAERRKLCDFDTEVIQTIQCSNKRSRHGKV